MKIPNHPFSVIEWEKIEPVEHKGITGSSFWRTKNFGDVRVRLVEYSPNPKYRICEGSIGELKTRNTG